MLVFTFATTGSSVLNLATTTAVQQVPLTGGTDGPSSLTSIPAQVASVYATCATAPSANTATISFILYDSLNSKKVAVIEGTLAAASSVNAYRDSADGASGNYILTCTFADGTNKVDLNGYAQGVNTGISGNGLVWYVGIPNNASLGTLTVYVAPTRAI